MQFTTLGNSDVKTSPIGIGCNRLLDLDDKDAVSAVHEALERGVNHFDTAESYGNGRGEEFLGEVVKDRRADAMIASKFGMRPGPNGAQICGTPEYVREACDASLQRLATDYIDLYYQHRVDPDVPLEETWGALKELMDAGKVKSLGISRADREQIRRAHAVHPVAALQSEYSLFNREVEADVLPVCGELGITFVAYGPLAYALLGGAIANVNDLPEGDRHRRNMTQFNDENIDHNRALLAPLKEVAAEVGATPAQISIAWLMAGSSDILPIPGSRRPIYVQENSDAADIALTPEQVTKLNQAYPLGVTKGSTTPQRR